MKSAPVKKAWLKTNKIYIILNLIMVYLIWKSGSSNLFIDRMYPVVAFRTSLLILLLKDGFPNRSGFSN